MSSSTNPPVPPAAKAQAKALTVKEQRAAARAQKLEEYKKREAKARRNRKIGIGAAVAGAVVIVALVVSSIVLTPQRASYTAGGDGATIEGVETFENTSNHVEGTVDYAQNPPAGGEHNQMWLNCGVYDQPVPNENAVHSLEHGAVWVTYDASISEEDLNALKLLLPRNHVILSPYEDLPAPIVLSAWNSQLQVDSVDDERIGAYLEEFWKSQNVPEPGASCSGALDAPGKVS